MLPLKFSVSLMYVLSIWTLGCAGTCGQHQKMVNGLCCDQCRPGEYLKKFCTRNNKSVCVPCAEGFFSSHFSMFDRCEECRSCNNDSSEKCNKTTDTKCSCPPGFLCSDKQCSTCERNKCAEWERVNRTDFPSGEGLTTYSYSCAAACPPHAYFDVKDKNCRSRTQCSALGLAELLPGNITHNAVCDFGALVTNKGGDPIHIILGVSLLLLSLCFIAMLSARCMEKLRTHKANGNDAFSGSATTADFRLSKEECGPQLSIPAKCTDCRSLDKISEEEITTLWNVT